MRHTLFTFLLLLASPLAQAQTAIVDHQLFTFAYPSGWTQKPNTQVIEINGPLGEVLLVNAKLLPPLDPPSIQKRFEALEKSFPGLMEKQTAAEGYRAVEPISVIPVRDGLTILRFKHVAERPDGKASAFVYAHLQHLRYALLTFTFNKSAADAQSQADAFADGFKWRR
jgi:hypothetical protein